MLIEMYPNELTRPFTGETLMHAAARGDNIPALEMLCNAGVPVDVADEKSRVTPLHVAALDGRVNALKWLLMHGALSEGIRTNGQTPLIAAAMKGHRECVLSLIDHGAMVNASYDDGPRKKIYNALTWASANGHQEIARLLRERGAILPDDATTGQPERPPESHRDILLQHLERHLGESAPWALVEVVPSDLPIEIVVFSKTCDADSVAIATIGMSSHPMTVPADVSEQLTRAELVMHLPGNWPLGEAVIDERESVWPLGWLRALARFPHDKGLCFGQAIIVSQDDVPELSATDTRFVGALIIRNVDDYGQLILTSNDVVSFYDVLPLYREEADLALEQGISALTDRLDEQQVLEVVDPHRTNVAIA